jgi:hypothetical protein
MEGQRVSEQKESGRRERGETEGEEKGKERMDRRTSL